MNSFAVLDSPEPDEGVRTRSKQRRKSKGKAPSEEDIAVPDVQSPKSSRKKKEKGAQPAAKQEANVYASAQDELPSTTKRELASDQVTEQEEQRKLGLVGQVVHWIDVKIFQYNVTFGLYMLDRWERWLFNICAFSLIFAVGYSSYKIARPYTAALQVFLESLVKQDEAPE
ncbi:hypothetical protein KFL_001480100 [Klebsormidium nitens]|uniref:Uncharacterized protein n=1 Tax=Klebsormidium nitens TaxID=105231 RepID=A0A1Y1I2N4_KLENI|nr:hypothetical protein KFL_001480100 [Klebsormidium nitens]|eukprot:GAQ83441.1 hypothetical protein KFL_001480100 [Klebsormidium nitens]